MKKEGLDLQHILLISTAPPCVFCLDNNLKTDEDETISKTAGQWKPNGNFVKCDTQVLDLDPPASPKT